MINRYPHVYKFALFTSFLNIPLVYSKGSACYCDIYSVSADMRVKTINSKSGNDGHDILGKINRERLDSITSEWGKNGHENKCEIYTIARPTRNTAIHLVNHLPHIPRSPRFHATTFPDNPRTSFPACSGPSAGTVTSSMAPIRYPLSSFCFGRG